MQQPTPPPQKRRTWPIVLAIIAAVMILCCVGAVAVFAISGDDDTSSSSGGGGTSSSGGGGTSSSGGGDDEGGSAPGVGDPVRDGKFEFVVTDVEAGVEEVGSGFLAETATGQFVVVRLTVENIGDRAQHFSAGDQKLIDDQGREHSSDTGAGLALAEDFDMIIDEVNPGNRVEAVVVFDIPADAVPVKLRLHDSFLSGGVEVLLGES